MIAAAPSLLRRREHVGVEGLRLAEPVRVPHLAHDALARDRAPRLLDQQREQVELLRAQDELVLGSPRAPSGPVHDHVSDPQRHRLGALKRLAAAEVRPNPRQQLREPERLDHVVVGARVEARDDVELLVARGEDEDAQVGTRGAQLAAHVEPVHVGQAQVEDHEVERRWRRPARRCHGSAGEPRGPGSRAHERAPWRSPRRPRPAGFRSRTRSDGNARDRRPTKFDPALTWACPGPDGAARSVAAHVQAHLAGGRCDRHLPRCRRVRRLLAEAFVDRRQGRQSGRRHPRQPGLRCLRACRRSAIG